MTEVGPPDCPMTALPFAMMGSDFLRKSFASKKSFRILPGKAANDSVCEDSIQTVWYASANEI